MTESYLPFPPEIVEQRTDLFNADSRLCRSGDRCFILMRHTAVYSYAAGDPAGEARAMAHLLDFKYATQEEIARVYGVSVRTVRRLKRLVEQEHREPLMRRSGWPKGRPRMPVARKQRIERLKADGLSNREIGRQLGVSEKAIRKQVGPTKGAPVQLSLLGTEDTSAVEEVVSVAPVSAAQPPPEPPSSSSFDAAPTVTSLDRDPRDRSIDRSMAALGMLDDAAPLFADAKAVPGAGVLFALPALVHSGVFRLAAKHYVSIGPAFFGLRTALLVLLFMTLWRIKSPEGLKERDPASLGLVLGLDRAPEVKTLRRKLTHLAARHKAVAFGRDLASLRVEQRGALMGFLYVDGHVRAYHGNRDLPKTHVARMRLAMPATTDYWTCDASGDPLFVFTADANAGLTLVMRQVLDEVRSLVGQRRVTIVFDRGGWKLELFKQMLALGFDILTYRKGKAPLIDEKLFSKHAGVVEGQQAEYLLHDEEVSFLDSTLRLRQVTRLGSRGKQTQIVTSRRDLPALEVAVRMFSRWREENFFKYARAEFALDALVDYQVEPDDPTRTVPNPGRRELAKKIKTARNEIARLEQSLGTDLVKARNSNKPALDMLAAADEKIQTDLQAARRDLERLRAELKETPTRVALRDLSDDAVFKLATERKHLTNIVKLLAFQAESDLLALLESDYSRCDDEGRTLLHELFAASADLHPTHGELRVVLHPLSSPHRTAAAACICYALNETQTRYPGTNLKLRFEIAPLPRTCLAFPGPTSPRQTPPADDPPANS